MTAITDEAVLRAAVGAATLARGREYLRQGAVTRVQWPDQGRHIYGEVRGSGRRNYSSIALVTRAPGGGLREFRGTCTCPVGANCKHSVALVLAALPAADTGRAEPALASWERSLAGLVRADPSAVRRGEASIGLQFELAERALRVRPVLPGRNGGWVRQGVSWSSLDYLPYGRAQVPDEQLRLLGELAAMDPAGARRYYSSSPQPIDLAAIASPRVWELLVEARAHGVALVEAAKPPRPLTLVRERAEVRIDVARGAGELVLRAHLALGGFAPELAHVLLLGSPAHGLAWRDPGSGTVHLAALARPLDDALADFARQGRVAIPERDEDRFLTRYYPALRTRVAWGCADGSVVLPEPLRPRLVLSAAHRSAHRLDLRWSWRYALGDEVRDEPLQAGEDTAPGRDPDAEAAILRTVAPLLGSSLGLVEDDVDGRRLAPAAELSGFDVIRFADEVLPRLRDLPDVDVVTTGPAVTYRETAEAPLIAISGSSASEDRDWFDLAVDVSVGGEDVPFEQLFLALASGQSHFVLPSGSYFALDRQEFTELAGLIAEARALQDAPSRGVRLNRFQTSLWDDLDRLGVVTGQAAAWSTSARALREVEHIAEAPAPEGLRATLRPYQRCGFAWLAFLYEHGLGGILADEMGLGKTVQVIALMCHAKERDLARAPFLVVAPTSVVFNWAGECERFAPGLRVRTITETAARRGTDLAAAVADADVVVTSYTLFRLEHEQYAALDWSGLFLDEAQFAKNQHSRNYACARTLAAPFKLAITGTPMENNLAELWSLLSITAPGLFASAARFETVYRRPIEKGGDPELLARLRRRIRPLMLRRAKRDVLLELPDKQEQVIELALNPKHARVYRTHLQRERQKVLGLLDDLDGNRFEIFRSLTLLRQACLDAALVDPAYSGVPATKLDALMELLGEISGEGHRTLVFSQFTRFLDAARRRLDAAGIAYCYLDGKTRRRAAVLAEFKSGTAPVFLISLKAGGFGLNLTEADYCVLLDPWWNPATEAQAVDRVHRIGQHKKVMVYRLVAKDTIEEKVMALKAGKAALFDSVLAGGEFAANRLSADDIRGMLDAG